MSRTVPRMRSTGTLALRKRRTDASHPAYLSGRVPGHFPANRITPRFTAHFNSAFCSPAFRTPIAGAPFSSR